MEIKMKIVVAMDSFKGSVSSYDAGKAVCEGIKKAVKNADVKIFPVADGGEGTVDALVSGLGGEKRSVEASDPLGRKIQCEYGVINGRAVIETASCAGLTLLDKNERDPLFTTTFGVGEMIKKAAEDGCRDFIIGLGGSATNDGGVGMLQALGFDILDKCGAPVKKGAEGLESIAQIKDGNVIPELSECNFTVACDVKNPLCGENGASKVFAPQKGADKEMTEQMDLWMRNYAKAAKEYNPGADADASGAGAAGGLGFAFMTFLSGGLRRGIDIVLDMTEIEKDIKDADFVITGEGRLDGQSAMGKTPVGIAQIAKKHNKPVIALAGCVEKEAAVLNGCGIDAYFPVLRKVSTLEYAMDSENACRNIADTAEQVFRLINICRH